MGDQYKKRIHFQFISIAMTDSFFSPNLGSANISFRNIVFMAATMAH